MDSTARRSTRAVGPALLLAVVATVSLVLPWLAIGSGPARSTIDLIGAAGALDVLSDGERLAVLAAWIAAPVTIAVALMAASVGHHRAAAALVLVVGATIVTAAAFVFAQSALRLGWGGVMGAAAATVAIGCAAVALAPGRS